MASSTATAPDRIEMIPVTQPVIGTARVPGSKSITNRALPIAGLANGHSSLTGALFSDDTHYMAEGLAALGIDVEAFPEDDRFEVDGGDGQFPATEADLFIGNSGTTARFLTAILAIGHGTYRLDGVPRMRQRPIGPLLSALRQLDVDATSEAGTDAPPIIVRANGLAGGRAVVPGDLSSQFFTGLLLAAPYARDGVTIEVEGELVSKPYITITADVMRAFGVETEIDDVDWKTFRVAPGQRYAARDYHIEPDASNASYFFAAAAVTGGEVRVNGLGTRSTQGDLQFVRVLEQMGATVTMTETSTTVRGPQDGVLHGGDFDFNVISDTAQTLAAIAPYADAPITIRGVAHNRVKETDRIADVATELRRLGQVVDEFQDGLTIHPQPVTPAEVHTYDDHRMAMSFALTGLRAPGVTILDPGCTAKTFPDYFDRLGELVK
ncbi:MULTISPECIES: 3-phosphoshikimate 1-carboxyvinyltransferase [Burkholderiales]|jgi:3-phosphoshikimate 1-carboxyvinyltransferase|uniref:3-phosphoshikimate 1-carboxyvinyltransferase n=1 Tax=Burkholderiales TaxID=80840 RepID=UPI000B404293|nr:MULTISPECIES: 3-phosphoshikimate 1-carboxyvinyltransferase [Burkholderiales]MDR5736055.1 3-phosphoshikimate 1-carboxyvinyltransferase [Caballeronia sp. LZ025]